MPVVASFETVATVLVGILMYGESSDLVKVAGICLVLLSIVAMNMDFARVRSSAAVRLWHESMAFNGRIWQQEKIADYNDFVNSGDWQTWVAPR